MRRIKSSRRFSVEPSNFAALDVRAFWARSSSSSALDAGDLASSAAPSFDSVLLRSPRLCSVVEDRSKIAFRPGLPK